MSWFELERLVEDAEKEPQLARALRHCRSNPELVLAARRLGVWAVPGGIQRPWDYRRGRRGGTGSNDSSNSSSKPGYSGSRYRCKQIGNWAKAQELLKQGHSYLDRDGDGEACKSLR